MGTLTVTLGYLPILYDKWKGTEYVLAFGDNLAAWVIAHNGRSGQPVKPGTASGTNLANNAATPNNQSAGATITNTPAGSTTTVGAGSAAEVAAVLVSLGAEFMAQFMNSAKQQSTDGTTRADDEPNPLDAGVLDSASFRPTDVKDAYSTLSLEISLFDTGGSTICAIFSLMKSHFCLN